MPHKDPEARKQYDREKYQRNKEKIKKRSRRRYHADPQKSIQQNLEWQRKNRDHYNAYHREWRSKQSQDRRDKVAKQSREWRKKNSGKVIATVRRYEMKHPWKIVAHAAVNTAVRVGILIRPTKCDYCGKSCKPHGHHSDYSKMLEVTWPCALCHRKIHDGKLSPIPRTALRWPART